MSNCCPPRHWNGTGHLKKRWTATTELREVGKARYSTTLSWREQMTVKNEPTSVTVHSNISKTWAKEETREFTLAQAETEAPTTKSPSI